MMDIDSESIHHVIHPTAAFTNGFASTRRQAPVPVPDGAVDGHETSWSHSPLNPKNRIDSLTPLREPLWRIDGCTGLGTQYYAVPLFLGDTVPMRFDVFIPEDACKAKAVRDLLDFNAAFHTKDGPRLQRLGICQLILRRLQLWTSTAASRSEVADMYETLPFGSRIIFSHVEVDIRRIRITVAPTYYVEKQLLSLSTLPDVLGLDGDVLPPTVDITALALVQQLHDSVCLVRYQPDHGTAARKAIFKALTSGTKYLYSELRALLRMPPHRHVIERPERLVTMTCRFGRKVAVVGILLEWHSGGSLREDLPLMRLHGRLSPAVQATWAVQLVSALVHVREAGRMFYPDLRLDNMVLSDRDELVMVDFEQRGVWCEFASPEVNALDYARILAGEATAEGDRACASVVPARVVQRWADVLERELPAWRELDRHEHFTRHPHGYDSFNVPWLCLTAAEQEAATVFMLGRVLWCLFEGQSAPQQAAVWQSYRVEPEYEFPVFRHTPDELRELMDACTRGRRPGLSSVVIRRGSKLVLRADAPARESSADDVMRAARDWWAAELEASEQFLTMRHERRATGAWTGNYFHRPSLREVAAALEAFRRKLVPDGHSREIVGS